ncbi:MAG: hypothetical protein GX610_10190 [Rhodococcus sp.]|nr:hypothetical protein [Rhodococcus sp. (in: high G+C Gram-positive bacteria)]
MTTPSEHSPRHGTPGPPPPRPEVAITPMRTTPSDRIPKAVTVALVAWGASVVLLAGIAGAVLLDLADVRNSLERAVSAENPGDDPADIADTIGLTLIGSAGFALVLALVTALGAQLLRRRKASGRVVLAATGVAAVAGGIGFWMLMSDAGDATAGVLQWAPLAYCAVVAVAVIALFAPNVGAWLD